MHMENIVGLLCSRIIWSQQTHRGMEWSSSRTVSPVLVTRSAPVAHRYTHATLRCKTLQYRKSFIPVSMYLWYDLADPVFTVWIWQVSRAGPMVIYCPIALYQYYGHSAILPFLYFLSIGWNCWAGSSD